MKRLFILFYLTTSTFLALSQSDSIVDSTQPIRAQNVTIQVNTDSTSLTDQITQLGEEVSKSKTSKLKIEDGPPDITEIISFTKVFWAIVFMIGGYIFIRLTTKALGIFAERSTNHRITIKGFMPVVKILGWITIIFIVIAGIFHPPAATVLAFSASIGVAVGFASQDILKNIFGGVMILFDRPFKSGDKIEVGSHYGEVVEIGLRSTRIVTPDDSLVSIPNSEIMNHAVSNANSGESNCLVVAEIYLPIEANTALCRSIATQSASVSRYVYTNKPITIVFANEFKDRKSILKMKVKAYVLDIRDEFKFKSEITEITLKKLIEEKIIQPEQH